MWIFLGILAFIIILIIAILLLPVYVILRSDENGEVYLRYKILFKTFGEDPDPNNPIIKTLLDASGISELKGDKSKYEPLLCFCRRHNNDRRANTNNERSTRLYW